MTLYLVLILSVVFGVCCIPNDSERRHTEWVRLLAEQESRRKK